MIRILEGDCRNRLRDLPDDSVQCCVSSPPYFGLRDYGVDGQIGLEETPEAFVAELVAVFREVRRVLRQDGTLWLNLGDSYANDGKFGGATGGKHSRWLHGGATRIGREKRRTGLKPKDLIGIPWRVAFALQADGWYLRQDIIWNKPNPLPEPVRDRCTKAHEYLFLLSKAGNYFYDADAIREPVADATAARLSQDISAQKGSKRANGGAKTNGNMKAVGSAEKRNARSVWTIPTQPFSAAHFATFPPDLAERCIRAGSKLGDTVLDPFGGAGTTGLVADRLGRDAVLIELNPEYAALTRRRIAADAGLFAAITTAAPSSPIPGLTP
ncbi:DNA modification methylase [Azospirillum brasilense]|uniref:Methyltransferase n=1 Tax=Azospirillum brasilense TaxID=192 RepID=A0A560BNE8_AZOBR|nr:site-specific DNA-methyltransferase [Azospirillum brasilense]TWA74132.1 DNA modification methylase [Azospirillum brasilense]